MIPQRVWGLNGQQFPPINISRHLQNCKLEPPPFPSPPPSLPVLGVRSEGRGGGLFTL